jgi:hypothetical protein
MSTFGVDGVDSVSELPSILRIVVDPSSKRPNSSFSLDARKR